MSSDFPTVLIMAAGTGGHVFPALSIAKALEQRGARVHWLGTPTGMENQLLKEFDFPIHQISVSGLRGSGFKRKILAPFMLLSAFRQSLKVLRKTKPDCVLGMGGFVCGPAGIAARIRGIPLLIHEQNATAGLTNRLLCVISNKVLEAFPGTFTKSSRVLFTGNPVREEIASISGSRSFRSLIDKTLNVLVLGGSQGAAAINRVLPNALASLDEFTVNVIHQTGKNKCIETERAYQKVGLSLGPNRQITEFVADMAASYQWADLVICRSGASTVSEIAVVGIPSVLIPYPYHRDNQQLLNARWLESADAAIIVPQDELDEDTLLSVLKKFLENPKRLISMGDNAARIAVRDAASVIADVCMEHSHV
ncbi:MAG: undecaprenyldiphospho-muramoylpentapeptide beta-N-acetylglucosaminyltransferase [Pseudohongiellaceae bacterium]